MRTSGEAGSRSAGPSACRIPPALNRAIVANGLHGAAEQAGVRTVVADTSQGPDSIESLISGPTNTIGDYGRTDLVTRPMR
ncbi:hypothetical protein GCM10027570_43130 [Streptomonospora sediminis]